jgi:uncharacterized protein involved in exopolysaccharide biosynthesis
MAVELDPKREPLSREYSPIVEDTGARAHLSILGLADTVSRHPGLVLVLPLLVALLLVLPSFIFGRSYVARSSFMPEVAAGGSQRFAGLAAQLGLSTGALGGNESLESYVDLARSRAILSDVARRQYRLVRGGIGADTVSGTLLDVYRVQAPTPEQRLLIAVERLRANLDVRANAKSGVISIATTAPSRELAEALNRSLLDVLSEFNLRKRQTRASAERAFVSERLRDVQAQMAAAERAVESFLERNRTYQGSPQLTFELNRLQRRLDLVQQVYGNLAQAHEQARIEEVRNTPVITVVDLPEGSSTWAKSRRRQAMLGLLLGLLLALAAAFGLDAVQQAAARDPLQAQALGRRLERLRLRFGRRSRDDPRSPAAGQSPLGRSTAVGDDS